MHHRPSSADARTPRARGLAPLLVLALAVGACDGEEARLVGPADPDVRTSGPLRAAAATGTIAFERDNDIWVMNPDGSGQTRLTSDPAEDQDPAVSPSGNRIAFVSRRDGAGDRYELFLMNADGSGVVQLTDRTEANPAHDHTPAWSPDGSQLVFIRQFAGSAQSQIIVRDVVGGGETFLDSLPVVGHPAWSPDGTKIAFAGFLGIYVMDSDGDNIVQLTFRTHPEYDNNPVWSPDGTKIAVEGGREVQKGIIPDIFVMNADGSGQTNLTNDPDLFDQHPAWSPDGSRIAYEAGTEIFAMDTDGANKTNLTGSPESDVTPSWGGGSATPPPDPDPDPDPDPEPEPDPEPGACVDEIADVGSRLKEAIRSDPDLPVFAKFFLYLSVNRLFDRLGDDPGFLGSDRFRSLLDRIADRAPAPLDPLLDELSDLAETCAA